ncbi:hypothetical protein B296_00004357 [Ensete ventricosum]|uniref:Uncharacterized protein n=1 Tax=Ensete ventricosum TaxID=4639 RepID=A0A426YY41_ENSVE|nr:hypothetical protein B296_00004357 [Ensete ventricosum]
MPRGGHCPNSRSARGLLPVVSRVGQLLLDCSKLVSGEWGSFQQQRHGELRLGQKYAMRTYRTSYADARGGDNYSDCREMPR